MKKKEQIELAVIAVGIVFMIFFLVTKIILPLTGSKKSLKPPAQAKSGAQKTTKQAPGLKPSLLAKKTKASFAKGKPVYPLWDESTRDMELMRDPFSQSVAGGAQEAKERTRFNLQGIIWNSVRPTAIINGDVVAVGDRLLGAKVIRIEKDCVILNNGVSDTKLSL